MVTSSIGQGKDHSRSEWSVGHGQLTIVKSYNGQAKIDH